MKKMLIILCLHLSIGAFAQEWAPIGSKWYYGEGQAFSPAIDYILYTSEKDTVVKGIGCRKITKRHDVVCYNRPAFEIMFSRNDSVFFYDAKLDTFQLLYNFNAKVNDSWSITYKDAANDARESVTITVDSIGSVQANSHTLKAWYVTYTTWFIDQQRKYPSKIIERIGDTSFMFNFYPSRTMACDVNYSKGIRCYEDSEIGNYHFPSQDECTYIYTSVKSRLWNEVRLFPNPTGGVIHIEGLKETGHYTIADINGKVMKSGSVTEPQIDISSFSTGIYFITLIDSQNRLICQEKVVKK